MEEKNKRKEFEDKLKELLNEISQNTEEYLLIKEAVERLDNDPDVFVGNPNDIFSYEDSVLAELLYICNSLISELSTESGKSLISLGDPTIDNGRWIEWIKTGLSYYRTKRDENFPKLKQQIPQKSIINEKQKLRIAIIGDAGYKGVVQDKVLGKIKELHNKNPFDYLIHLGDIYFGGSNGQMLHNFLAPFQDVGPRVFNVLGNHDLYYGGSPILDVLKTLQQPGRFFCIENKNWIIACLDTSFPASSRFRSYGELDNDQINWLRKLINENPQKKLVLLSHHYIDSGWSKGSDKLRTDIQPFIPNIFSWYWGHEHNCATYHKNTLGYYGACIGNGVFMEKWSSPKTDRVPDWFPKNFCGCSESGFSKAWQHGFLELELLEDKLIENYHVEHESDQYSRKILI